MREGRGVYRILVGRPEGKRPVGRPRRRWEGKNKLDLKEIGIDEANSLSAIADVFILLIECVWDILHACRILLWAAGIRKKVKVK